MINCTQKGGVTLSKGKKKKSSNRADFTEKILTLITAIINLIIALLLFIEHLTK